MAASILLTLLSPIVALCIALWGFRRSSRADRLRAFFELYDRYLAAEMRAGRRLIHERVTGRSHEEIEAMPQELRDSIGRTLAMMNSIAIACEGGYVDRALIAESMGRSYSTAVLAARPYIDYFERRRGFRPYPFAERLGRSLASAADQADSVDRVRPDESR